MSLSEGGSFFSHVQRWGVVIDNYDNKTLILRHISKLGSLIGALHNIQSTCYFIVSFKVYIYVQLKTFSEQMSFEC